MAKMNSMGGPLQNGINPPNPQLQGIFSFLNNNPAFQRAIMPSFGQNNPQVLNPNAGFAPQMPKPNTPLTDNYSSIGLMPSRGIEPVPATPIAPSDNLLSKLGARGRGFMV